MRQACVAVAAAIFLSTVCHAQNPLSVDPDEGGIGGTGHGDVSTQKPELIDRPEMPERIEHVERVETVDRVEPPGVDVGESSGMDGEITVEPPGDRH